MSAEADKDYNVGDDLCDQCMRSGIVVSHTDDKGNTVCLECAEGEEAVAIAQKCRTCGADVPDAGDGYDGECGNCADARTKSAQVRTVLQVLAKIADAYDDNNLDDEARKFWGMNLEHENTTAHENIELYNGRGGHRLLTLADCMRARDILQDLGTGWIYRAAP